MTVKRLRVLERAATPGPWEVERGARALWVAGGHDEPGGAWPIAEITGGQVGYEQPNAALIAAARNALPLLLTIAEAALADLTMDGRLPLRVPNHFGPGVNPETHPARHRHRIRAALIALTNQEPT